MLGGGGGGGGGGGTPLTATHSHFTTYTLNPCSNCRGVLEIWKIMLDRTDAMARSLSTAADLLTSKVAESLRHQKKCKEQSYKKVSMECGWSERVMGEVAWCGV